MGNYKRVEIGLITPLELLRQQEPELVALYTYLLVNLKNSGSTIKTTTDKIADDLNVSRRTVLYHKKKLTQLGLIATVRHKNYCEWLLVAFDRPSFFGLVNTEEIALLEYTNKFKILNELHFLDKETEEVQKLKELKNQEVQRIDTVSSTGTESVSSSGSNIVTSSGNKPQSDLSNEIDSLDTSVAKSDFRKRGKKVKEAIRFSQELKPIPPALVSDVVKFGNKFPFSNDPGWFDSFIWLWATKRYALHGTDVMISAGDLAKMRVKLKLFFNNIVKNDWTNAENYLEWYLNCKDSFIKNTVAYGFEYMISTSAINKYLLTKRAPGAKNRPLFYDDTNRHQVRGKVF